MDTVLDQAGLIAFLVFYYIYGARFVGMILGLWRPIRGLEARPIYWDAGIGVLFIGFAVWVFLRLWALAPVIAVALAVVFGSAGALMLAEWATRRIWLEGETLKTKSLFGPAREAPLSSLAQASLGPGGFWLALERGDGGPAVKAPLSMDGLDGLYAALVRGGLAGPSFEVFQRARKGQRRR